MNLHLKAHQEKVTGGVLIGLGVSFLVAGVVLGALTAKASVESDCEDVGRPSDCWNTGTTTGELVGGVVLGLAGAAMLPAGLSIFMHGKSDESAARSLLAHTWVSPYATRDSAGVQLKLTF
jgi:hypothetical protein